MASPPWWPFPTILILALSCATFDAASGGNVVSLRLPVPVDGDPQALAWPFGVATGAGVNGFRLRVETGGTLVAVRPDTANPEPSAPGWTGSRMDAEAVWSGPALGQPVPLTIMVRAMGPGDQVLRVRYASDSEGGVSPWTCERWIYRVLEARIERDSC